MQRQQFSKFSCSTAERFLVYWVGIRNYYEQLKSSQEPGSYNKTLCLGFTIVPLVKFSEMKIITLPFCQRTENLLSRFCEEPAVSQKTTVLCTVNNEIVFL